MLYHVPCPKCAEMVPLEVSDLRWGHCKDLAAEYDLDRVLLETRCAGCKCGHEIEESEKRRLVDAGEWIATNYHEEVENGELGIENSEWIPAADAEEKKLRPRWKPGVMSARLSDMVSFWPGSGWGDLAVERIKNGSDPLKVRLISDNDRHIPYEVPANGIVIIGRACWRGGRI